MPEIVLSADQEKALAMIRALQSGEVLIISGPAGSGKSITLAEAFKREKARMALTPTGKAAARLRAAKIPARTIHSQLYFPREAKQGLDWSLRADDELDLHARDLIVVDEGSMMGPRIAADLKGLVERFGLRLVIVGDAFQLPPVLSPAEVAAWGSDFSVMRGDGFETAQRVALTEVFRQALESPVLRAATAIREGKAAPTDGDPRFVARVGGAEVTAEILSEAYKRGLDVIGVTWKNQDRHTINRGVRKRHGHVSPLPEPGEPVVVLSNARFLNLWNGEVLIVERLEGTPQRLRPHAATPTAVKAVVRRPTGELQNVDLVTDFLGDEAAGLVPANLYKESFGIPSVSRHRMLCVDWGYCLTAHKSQGSEWDVAIVYVPGGIMSVQDGWRHWVYTAMTRAKGALAIIADGQAGAVFELGGRRLATSILSPKPEAPRLPVPEKAPERVYFAHSIRDYGSVLAAQARAAIDDRWPAAELADPEKMDLVGIVGQEGGWDQAYRRIIHEECGKGGAVVVLEHMEHVGRGVFTAVTYALEATIPVWVYRAGRFQRVREAIISNAHDWKVAYGRLLVV